jgi:hypothetical protein
MVQWYTIYYLLHFNALSKNQYCCKSMIYRKSQTVSDSYFHFKTSKTAFFMAKNGSKNTVFGPFFIKKP